MKRLLTSLAIATSLMPLLSAEVSAQAINENFCQGAIAINFPGMFRNTITVHRETFLPALPSEAVGDTMRRLITLQTVDGQNIQMLCEVMDVTATGGGTQTVVHVPLVDGRWLSAFYESQSGSFSANYAEPIDATEWLGTE